uniref:Choline transporter-like protein n=1 Tax=Rhabditophanes sp. KR3021 TaxID=114890 RepID=A0AC35TQB2_9BILA
MITMACTTNPWHFLMQTFNAFVCFWITCIIETLFDLVVAGAFATIYFHDKNSEHLPEKIIRSSAWRSVKFHFGTICIGSISIAVVKYVRIYLIVSQFIFKLTERYFKIPVYSWIQCCFFVLDNFLVYMEKSLFVITAIHGTDFWSSANKSNTLISENKKTFCSLKGIMELSLFLGRVIISTLCGVCTYIFAYTQFKLNPANVDDSSLTLPCVIVTIGAYYISALFIDIFEFGSRTIYLCYLEDCSLNDGSTEKPYYMDGSLAEIFGKDIEMKEKKPRV